jgi:hypothetical protein
MNDNDFDPLPDNDWDDTWELAWSEFDWEKYLREQDTVAQAYLTTYEKCLSRPDRIDEVAHVMGWDHADWTADESDAGDGAPRPNDAAESSDSGLLDPYTIQKHPVYISTHALLHWLSRTWEFVVPTCGGKVPVRTGIAFPNSLYRAGHLGLLAIHSLDMGDYALCISQIKRTMVEINSALRHLNSIDPQVHAAFTQFHPQALLRLFDVREIWLRVMRDCREELDRRVGGPENSQE